MNKNVARSNFQKYYLQLNDRQKEAVDTIEGPVLVIAGPGTGKTQTIALRIANILKQTQLNPYNILCLTFTESAVYSMRQRLFKIIGQEAHDVSIFTFHSFCNEIISSYPEKFESLEFGAESITDVRKIEIISDIIESFDSESYLKPFGNTKLYVNELLKQISNLKREDVSYQQLKESIVLQKKFFEDNQTVFKQLIKLHFSKLSSEVFTKFFTDLKDRSKDKYFTNLFRHLIEEFTTKEDDPKVLKKEFTRLRRTIKQYQERHGSEKNFQRLHEFVNVYKQYQQRLVQEKLYDYEDMIVKVVSILREDNELLSIYQEKYQYILIDEYQDTNSSQNEVISLLGSFFDNPNIFVVGDDDQSIFRFQGASLENVTYFFNRFRENIKVITLQDNYRSQQNILDASYSMILQNEMQLSEFIPDIDKKLISRIKIPKSQLEVNQYEHYLEQLVAVSKKVRELVNSGTSPGSIGVIYRENRESTDLAKFLIQDGLSINISGKKSIFAFPEVANFERLLRYIINPQGDNELFYILNQSYFKIKGLDIIKMIKYGRRNKIDLQEIISNSDLIEESNVKDSKQIVQISDNFQKWRKDAYNLTAEDFILNVLNESNFLKHILEHKKSFELIQALNVLVTELRSICKGNHKYTIVDFIKHLDIIFEQKMDVSIKKEKSQDESHIQLMTAHSAKGLEFDYVFIINATKNKWGKKARRDKIKLPPGLLSNTVLNEGDDEERRLFYVAMTRARKSVFISYSNNSDTFTKQYESVFISEIDKQYVSRNEVEVSNEDHKSTLIRVLKPVDKIKYSNEGKNYLAELLQEYKLSFTHLIAYQNCPRCFLYDKLLSVPSKTSKVMSFGNVVHKTLKYYVRQNKKTNKSPTLPNTLKYFEEVLNKELLNESEYKDALDHGQRALRSYIPILNEKINDQTLSEYSFFGQNVFSGDVPITGTIDRVDFKGRDLVNVVDYKTGNPDNKQSKLSVRSFGDYLKQLVFYKILILNSKRLSWRVNKGIVEFVEPSRETGQTIVKQFDLTDEMMKNLADEIDEVYNKIMANEFDETNDKDCYTPEYHQIKMQSL